jgi:lipopolysaccharide transport system permease protein
MAIAAAPELTDRVERIGLPAYLELLLNLTRREVKGRYSQSLFGIAWAIAQPLATMLVFTFVFSRLGQIPSGGAPYPLFAYAALVPWFFFSNSILSGTQSLITYRTIVTKTYFPREIIPLAQVAARLIDFAAAATLFGIMLAWYGVPVTGWAWYAVLFFALLVIFTCGVTLLTSAVNVFYRDVGPVVTIGLQLWLYLTPVAYPLAVVPERFRPLFALNPLAAIVEGNRAALVFGRAPEWPLVATAASITLAVATAGYILFKRLDRYFADVI